MTDTTTGRLDWVESRFAIGDLVSNYCHGMDKHDLELFLSIWHDDAQFLPGEPFGAFQGRDAIGRAATELIWPGLPTTRHHTVNLVVEIEGDKATGLSDVGGLAVDPDGTEATVAATYEDVYERRGGVWRIAVRRLVVHDFSGLGDDWRLDGG